jgi:undecaprenyl-diphosphatase
MNDVKLLVPHGADGGMPSHHMVFMVSIAVIIYFFNKRLSFLLIILSVISGIARISAGIHYPSDVLAGAFAGGVIAIIYARIMFRGKRNFISLK